ncbi:MoaF C-terminal domain-containing protein [Halomonas sp. WWR20]
MSEHSPHHDSSSPWITVGDLGAGFAPDSFALDHRADLDGRDYALHFEDGQVTRYRFDATRVTWPDGEADYRATTLRDGIYLIDFLAREADRTHSVSLVLDTVTSSFTRVIGRMPTAEAIRVGLYEKARKGRPLSDVTAEFQHGSLDTPWHAGACPHRPTYGLIGKRLLYRYSPTEVYEHIYLNDHFYTWHCVKGVEQGLCDTDSCHYLEIADQLYLFVWREKIIPTLGLVMIDTRQHRSDGKLFGYSQDDTAELANFPVASYCTLLNTTEYPDG